MTPEFALLNASFETDATSRTVHRELSVALTDHEAARESTRVFDSFEAYLRLQQ